ncbi:unnamed protein product [Pleuronectes platessa]|uniref:Uncharacterized protein n=1 Tax=Pleuronectes platessa TaxID=8262 RepID=A0A9N7UQA5_PLEPL|nr:unnamed protein product [Pleuronectes platessa]
MKCPSRVGVDELTKRRFGRETQKHGRSKGSCQSLINRSSRRFSRSPAHSIPTYQSVQEVRRASAIRLYYDQAAPAHIVDTIREIQCGKQRINEEEEEEEEEEDRSSSPFIGLSFVFLSIQQPVHALELPYLGIKRPFTHSPQGVDVRQTEGGGEGQSGNLEETEEQITASST